MNYYTKPTPNDFKQLEQKHDTAFDRGYKKGIIHGMVLLTIILASLYLVFVMMNDKKLKYHDSLNTYQETVLVDMVQVRDKTTGELIDEYRP